MPNVDDTLLPDGTEFAFWEAPLRYERTLVVAREHPSADDANEGTDDAPLKTIQAAADRARPGARVLVRGGVYGECVRPPRGGEGPDRMISYVAAPGEDVVVSGAEIVADWQPSTGWHAMPKRLPWAGHGRGEGSGESPAEIWVTHLPRDGFDGQNPFAAPNRAISSTLGGFVQAQAKAFGTYFLRCGLLFQDGQRLEQVSDYTLLARQAGRYFVDPAGMAIHMRPFDDVAPETARFEATFRRQCFAPDVEGLGYIRVRGFTFRHAGNCFPFMPQEGAVSSHRGHHWILEGCTVEQVNSIGIDFGRRDPRMRFPEPAGHHVIRGNVARECGICGLAGLGAFYCLIEDNLVEDCCWHDTEEMWESAGIKFHRNQHTLVRRNVVRRIAHGSGIWLDFENRNMRCTGNVIAEVESLFGGVFVEASHVPNRVDRNVIVGMRAVEDGGGHGIYCHDTDYLQADHNMMADCDGVAIHLPKGQADRFVDGRGSLSKRHVVHHNLFAGTGRYVSFQDAENVCDANALAGCRRPGPWRMLGEDQWLDLETWRAIHGLDTGSAEIGARVSFDASTLTLRIDTPQGLPELGPVSADDRAWYRGAADDGKNAVGPGLEAAINADACIDPRKDLPVDDA